MPTYCIEEVMFSRLPHFTIKDDAGVECYEVGCEKWSLKKNLILKDVNGIELAQIIQTSVWIHRYEIYEDGVLSARFRVESALFKTNLYIDGPNWEIVGKLKGSKFDIIDLDGGIHASITRDRSNWGDTYYIDIAPGESEILLLATVIVLNAILDSNESSAGS